MGICAIFSSRKVHNIIKMEIGIMARIGPSHNIHTLEKLFHGKKENWFYGGAHIELSHNIHTLANLFHEKGNWFHGGAGIGRIMWNPCITVSLGRVTCTHHSQLDLSQDCVL